MVTIRTLALRSLSPCLVIPELPCNTCLQRRTESDLFAPLSLLRASCADVTQRLSSFRYPLLHAQEASWSFQLYYGAMFSCTGHIPLRVRCKV